MRTHGAAVIAVIVFMGPPGRRPCGGRWSAWRWAGAGGEMANTAIETLADHLHPGQHPEIGVVKDVAAGAVLVASRRGGGRRPGLPGPPCCHQCEPERPARAAFTPSWYSCRPGRPRRLGPWGRSQRNRGCNS